MNKRVISCILIAFMTITSLSSVFAETFDSKNDPIFNAEAWATVFGTVLGHQDRVNDREFDYREARSELDNNFYYKFEVDEMSQEYKNSFGDHFRNSFRVYYEAGYDYKPPKYYDDLADSWGYLYGIYDGYLERRYAGSFDKSLEERIDVDIKEYYGIEEVNFSEDEFIQRFTEKYTEAYEQGKKGISYNEDSFTVNVSPETVARNLGYTLGQKYGFDDFNSGKNFSLDAALSDYKANNDFIVEFGLDKLDDDESVLLNFEFNSGFSTGYSEAFFLSISDFSSKNMTTLQVGPEGFTTTISAKPNVEIEQGSVNLESYISITVDVPENSAYGEQYIDIYELEMPFALSDRYLPIKNIFYVGGHSNFNGVEKNYVSLLNDWTISFPFDGSYRVGIYKRENATWLYQPTEYDGTKVTLTIPAGDYYDGEYAVIIDREYDELNDIHNSWANEELFVFLRRDNLLYDDNFYYNPEGNMTRVELARILENKFSNGLYSTLDRELPFTDLTNDQELNETIKFSYLYGYINGTSETTYEPYGFLTYNQFETIISRVINEEYSLDEVFNKMKQEKFYKSKGEDDKNSFITRSEAVYALYELWK